MELKFKNSFNNIALIIFIILGFQAVIIKEKNCIEANKKSKICYFSKIISYPANYLYKGFNDTKKIVRDSFFSKGIVTSSRLMDPEETIERYKELEPGFTFYYEDASL